MIAIVTLQVLANCLPLSGADASGFPRVWTSVCELRTADEFEKAVIDCKAHGIDVISCDSNEKVLADRLAVCRKHGMKVYIDVEDACKCDWAAKTSGQYELAVMSGGCYRGLAIDRNLFSFTPSKHEIIVEPPVYSKGQAYAKHPHYYMLGQGHYYGGYVPTGKAEVVVPEKAFDGRQHLRIVPAKVEFAPEGAKPENDSAAAFADSDEVHTRKLVKLSFDLTGLDSCRLDKVGIAVYWKFDDSDPKWRSERASYSVFSPITRERMRTRVRSQLAKWTRANGGTFPTDVVVAVRLGDEIFNATGWLGCPAASLPLWDYSASALAAFAKTTPAGVTYPRTLSAEEFYGSDSYAQFLYLFHRAAADYLKGAVEEAHAVSPSILAFRNTTRGGVWDYANDHDGTGQELLTQVLDFVFLDPYPLSACGYSEASIPFDMSYLVGLARRYGKPIVPWMQAHSFPACGLVHPTAKDIRRMYEQHLRFEPDGMMWLGYKPGESDFTFPDNDPLSWEEAGRVHAEFKRLARRPHKHAELAVVRPYSARAVVGVDGRSASADEKLRDFVRDWSVRLGREYDVFEVPPFRTEEEKAALAKELKGYRKVISSVDWPGAENVAAPRLKPTPPLQKRLNTGGHSRNGL